MRVEQRLFADPVPGKEQRSVILVPDSEGEHPTQMLQTLNAVSIIEMNDHLRVRLGPQLMAALQQVVTQGLVIVDLAVKDDPFCTVLIRYRLLASGKVYDREASHGEADVLF